MMDALFDKIESVFGKDQQDDSEENNSNPEIDLKEVFAPKRVMVDKDSIKLNDKYYTMSAIESFPSSTNYNLMEDLLNHNLDTTFSMHIRPRKKKASLNMLRKELRKIRSEHGGRNQIENKNMQMKYEKFEKLSESLLEGNTKLFKFGFCMAHGGDDYEEMKKTKDINEETLSNYDITDSTFKIKKFYTSVKPMVRNRTAEWLPAHTDNIVSFFPFLSKTTMDVDGIYYGKDLHTDSPIFIDIWGHGGNGGRRSQGGYDRMIFGQKGQGKSFATKLIMLREKLKWPETKVMIIDPIEEPGSSIGEYGDIVKVLDGEVVQLSGTDDSYVINPLDPTLSPTISQATEDVITLFKTMFEMSDEERGFLSKCLKDLFMERAEERTVKLDTGSDIESYKVVEIKEGKEEPTIDDLIEKLSKEIPRRKEERDVSSELRDNLKKVIKGKTEAVPNGGSERKTMDELTDQTEEMIDGIISEYKNSQGENRVHRGRRGLNEEEARSLMKKLQPLHNGAYEALNNKTNVDVDSKIISFNIGGISNELMDFFMTLTLRYIWRETAKDYKKKIIIADEAQLLMDHEQTASFLEKYVRVVRHYHASTILISQSFDDFYGDVHGDAILDQASMHLLFRHSNIEEWMTEYYDLNESEARQMTMFDTGQCLLNIANVRTFAKIDATEKEHWLITTDPKEVKNKIGQ